MTGCFTISSSSRARRKYERGKGGTHKSPGGCPQQRVPGEGFLPQTLSENHQPPGQIDESEHYQRIQKLHETLQEHGKWPDTIPLTVKGTEIRSILRNKLDSVDSLPAADRDDVEAIKIAVDFEANGVSFYEKLRENADEPLEKEFYGMLASIEREHFLSLQDAFESSQDPAGWYLTKEKPHIDGG
jgi:hypothetical protein